MRKKYAYIGMVAVLVVAGLVGLLALSGCATSEPLSDKDYIRAMDRQNEEEWNRQLQNM